jgi:hypothetical protein
MNPDDRIRLTHMAEALGHAIRFIEGHGRADLDRDPMLTFALLCARRPSGRQPTTSARIHATNFRRSHGR